MLVPLTSKHGYLHRTHRADRNPSRNPQRPRHRHRAPHDPLVVDVRRQSHLGSDPASPHRWERDPEAIRAHRPTRPGAERRADPSIHDQGSRGCRARRTRGARRRRTGRLARQRLRRTCRSRPGDGSHHAAEPRRDQLADRADRPRAAAQDRSAASVAHARRPRRTGAGRHRRGDADRRIRGDALHAPGCAGQSGASDEGEHESRPPLVHHRPHRRDRPARRHPRPESLRRLRRPRRLEPRRCAARGIPRSRRPDR